MKQSKSLHPIPRSSLFPDEVAEVATETFGGQRGSKICQLSNEKRAPRCLGY